MTRVRAAIIGTGGIASSHAEAALKLKDRIEIVAAMDVDANRVRTFSDKHSISQRFTDLSELLTTIKPELVHLCTPPSLHTAQAIQCVEAGANVWCEKPLTGSLADFDRLTDAESRTGRFISTVFQWRSGSMGKHLKQLIGEGQLGRPLVATAQTLWYRDEAYYAVDWRGTYASELGGVTVGHGIHLMDFLLWLWDDWQDVRAVIATQNHQIEVDDVSMAIVRFKNGALASIVNSVNSPYEQTYLRLDFERLTCQLAALYHYSNIDWFIAPPEKTSLTATWMRETFEIGDVASGHTAALADLLDSLEKGVRPPVSGAESRRIIEFITCLYKSALTGETIERRSITLDDPFYRSFTGI